MVIGISVVESMVEHDQSDSHDETQTGPVTVVHALRNSRSTSSLRPAESFMDRARDITKKLRRKSNTVSLTSFTTFSPTTSR